MTQKFEQLIHGGLGQAKGKSSGANYRIPLRAVETRAALLLVLGLAAAAAPADPPPALDEPPAPAAAPEPDLKTGGEQLAKLRARIAALQQSLQQDRGQQDQVRVQIEDVERKQADLRGQLKTIAVRLDQQARAVKKTEAQRAQAEALASQHRKALGRSVRTAYIIGQRGQAKLLLNQDHAARLSRVLTYYDYLNRARVTHIREIAAHVAALATLEARLKDETKALETTRAQQQAALAALRSARAERKAMLRQLGTRIASKEDQLKEARTSEQQLAALLEQLRSALADVPADIGGRPFAQLKGKLPWPLRGKLLARFGELKDAGGLKWNGLWIEAIEGNPVRAVARGRVAYVGWQHRYGLIVVLEHEGGYYSLYGHNQSVAVNVGDWVNGGDSVATAGNSGGHEKTGLYFELRKGAEPVNPRLWLKKG